MLNEADVHAVQIDGKRIEYHKPDFGMAYSVIAPLVVEASTYFECGQSDKGIEALRKAKNIVDIASSRFGMLELTADGEAA